MRHAAVTALIALSLFTGCKTNAPDHSDPAPEPEPEAAAELVLRGGKIFTATETMPFATSLAITDGVITYVGDEPPAGKEVVELEGRLVLPGFHDVHQHTLEAQLPVIDCILSSAESDAENFHDTLTGCAPGTLTGWVLGWGHNVESLLWLERAPRLVLDDVFEDVPVAIMEMTSHSTWVNTRALDVLQIDGTTPDPPGGIIVRDAAGAPNGILVDSAGEWPWGEALQPTPALDEANYQALLDGLALNAEHGITSAVDARVYWDRGYLKAYDRAEAEDALTVRMVLALWAYPNRQDAEQLQTLATMYDDPGGMLRSSQVKIYADGLLQNTTAALLEPYLIETWGDPLGLSYFTPARLENYVTTLQKAGFDLHIHAIGDRGVRQALDAIEAAKAKPGGSDARHRLTHVELIHPDDIARFAALSVHADMQLSAEWTNPDQLHDNDPLIGADRVDERSWPAKAMHDAGVELVLSSDYDVGPISPFVGIQNAVTRGEQALPDVATAVKAYTINAAKLMRSETRTGSLEQGKLADLIVVDRDIFEISRTTIGQSKVLWTLVGGEEVHRAAGF